MPVAEASRRTLSRRNSECTLTGGGRQLYLEIYDHRSVEEARTAYENEEGSRKRSGYRHQPPIEHPGLGEQSLVDFSYFNWTVEATVIARKGVRMVDARYGTPGNIPMGKWTDASYYSAAKAVAQEVAGELLR